MTADYWFLAAPVAGATANLVTQLVLARAFPRWSLVPVMVLAFCAGLLAAAAMTIFALLAAAPSPLDALALSASILIIYSAAGFALFAIANLGETSLRIRLMRTLLENPEGVPRDRLMASYDESALVAIRLERLQDKAQARVADGVFYSRPSSLFFVAFGIRGLKRIIYGRY
jgi:hypothetical protein